MKVPLKGSGYVECTMGGRELEDERECWSTGNHQKKSSVDPGGLQALRVGLSSGNQLHWTVALIRKVSLREPCSYTSQTAVSENGRRATGATPLPME